MYLTKAVLCGMMLLSSVGCVASGYQTRFDVGVDYHVNSTQPDPQISAKFTIESK